MNPLVRCWYSPSFCRSESMTKIRYETMENLLVNLLVPAHRFNHPSIPSPQHYPATPPSPATQPYISTPTSPATQHYTSTPTSQSPGTQHFTSTPTAQSSATQHYTSTPSTPTITPLSPILHQNKVIVNNVSVDIMATAGMEEEALALDKTVVTELVVAEDGTAEMEVAEDGDGLSMTRVKKFIQVLSYKLNNKSCSLIQVLHFQCPLCKKDISSHNFPRHLKEMHSDENIYQCPTFQLDNYNWGRQLLSREAL